MTTASGANRGGNPELTAYLKGLSFDEVLAWVEMGLQARVNQAAETTGKRVRL